MELFHKDVDHGFEATIRQQTAEEEKKALSMRATVYTGDRGWDAMWCKAGVSTGSKMARKKKTKKIKRVFVILFSAVLSRSAFTP